MAPRVLETDGLQESVPQSWNAYGDGATRVESYGTIALQTKGNSQVFWGAPDRYDRMYRDVTVEGDVTLSKTEANAGLLVRSSKQGGGTDGDGYWVNLRLLDVGYAIVQLFRFPDFAMLQEARVRGDIAPGQPVHLKVTCRGPEFWVWANDLSVPAITEFDDRHVTPGFVGLKSEGNQASLSNLVATTVGATPREPLVCDWSWIKGAVFITAESVNSYQMWEEYHPEVIERELAFAQTSGLNLVQVYLDFLNWQKYGPVYLDHVEDFLVRAQRHGLKTTFIFFDDVGNVEPPHLAPVVGIS